MTRAAARTRAARARRRIGAFAGALACIAASATFTADPASADTIRTAEWPVSYLDLPAAQQLSTGSGVTVALLDTGVVQGRADLTGQVTTGPDYAGGIETMGEAGWGEHGTCMASIIAGHGRDGGGDGMLGVAPGAHILSVRVIRDDDAPDFGQPTTDQTPISDGIKYAVDHGAQVISMSLGGDEADAGDDSSSESDAIRYALAHNVVVVAAAGNGATDGNPVSYPGGERGVITVAAVDQNSAHAYFSTTGWDVAVAAPGVNLPCDAYNSDDEYEEGSGTSQATAYVSGLVALLKSENPALTPEQIRTLLEQTASDKPAGGRNDDIGFGIINPVAALQAAKGMAGLRTVPAAGPGVASGYFGYGPTEKVTLADSGTARRTRAEIGGAVLVVIALVVALLMLRRPKQAGSETVFVELVQAEPWIQPQASQALQPPLTAQPPQQPQVLRPPLPPQPPNSPEPAPGLGSEE